CAAIQGAELRFGLRAFQSDGYAVDCKLDIGANGNLRLRDRRFRPDNADRQRMDMLSQQTYLLAGIAQAPNREHRIILTNVGVKEGRIAPVVNDRVASRARVAIANGIEHPQRWRHYRVGMPQATHNRLAIPPHPATLARFVSMHFLPPAD